LQWMPEVPMRMPQTMRLMDDRPGG
jgi:hypothetical protein